MHKIGNYKLEGSIGQGGNGVVYRSTHPVLDRPIAVKALHQKISHDPALRRQFLSEARVTLDLNHPGIINVYDVDQDGEHAFIAMELFSGSLADAMDQRRIALPELLDIAAQIADALAYAHSKGVVHRDIKPSNVLLRADGSPVVADFGLALERAGAAPARAPSSEARGTPAYMAPEQLRGLHSDGRTDIYAFGVMLYQMVAGRLPFEGPIDLLVHGHLNVTPPRLRDLDPAVPLELDALIGRMLAKEPAQRPADMSRIAAQLRGIRATVPASAQSPVAVQRSRAIPVVQPPILPPPQPPATDETIRLPPPAAAPSGPPAQPIFAPLPTTSVPTARPGMRRFVAEAGMVVGLVGVCAALAAIALWGVAGSRETPDVGVASAPALTPLPITVLGEPLLTDPQSIVAGQERWAVGSVNVVHGGGQIDVYGVVRNDGPRARAGGRVRVLLLGGDGREIYSADDMLLGDYFEPGDWGAFHVTLTDYEIALPSAGQYDVAFEIRSSPANSEYDKRLRDLTVADTTYGRYTIGSYGWATTIGGADVALDSASAYAIWFSNDGRVLGLSWENAYSSSVDPIEPGATVRVESRVDSLDQQPSSMAVLTLAEPER